MLFKRRDKQKLKCRVRNYIWPDMGWKRTGRYYKHRILRIPATPYAIAFGLTAGVCISFTPTFGFHIIQALVLSFIFRGNYPAAVIGTIFGNPVTFPPLMLASYHVGNFVMPFFGWDVLSIDEAGLTIMEALTQYPAEIYMPTLLGGYLLGILLFPPVYGVFYILVTQAKRRMALKKKERK